MRKNLRLEIGRGTVWRDRDAPASQHGIRDCHWSVGLTCRRHTTENTASNQNSSRDTCSSSPRPRAPASRWRHRVTSLQPSSRLAWACLAGCRRYHLHSQMHLIRESKLGKNVDPVPTYCTAVRPNPNHDLWPIELKISIPVNGYFCAVERSCKFVFLFSLSLHCNSVS